MCLRWCAGMGASPAGRGGSPSGWAVRAAAWGAGGRGRAGRGLTELICHPGYESPELRAVAVEAPAYAAAGREAEVRALTTPGLREELERRGIALTHYGMLASEPLGPGAVPRAPAR